MGIRTTVIVDQNDTSGTAHRSRDADSTRRLLLEAARRRFAIDGYGSTTVRDIASEAGVNVALINRYFESKEGLFEACLNWAADELGRADEADTTVGRMAQSIVHRIAGAADAGQTLQMLLLLRTSGDDRADEIRRDTLRYFAERIAAAAGWNAGDPETQPLLVNAEIVLATALGIVLLRSSTGLQPLTSATEAELAEPIAAVLTALLSPPATA